MDDRKISICIPTYNRFIYTVASFENVLKDPRISEIILQDDCSTDDSYERLVRGFERHPKVKIFRNEKNMDCYFNKMLALSNATNDWCILFDSDNVIDKDYIDRLYEMEPWEDDYIYAPQFAQPFFDYRKYAGYTFSKEVVHQFVNDDNFLTLLNTCNFFVNRHEYLLCFDPEAIPITADSILMNYNWMHSGNKIYVVHGMQYFHRVHDGSHYIRNNHRTGNFYNEVIDKLKKLK